MAVPPLMMTCRLHASPQIGAICHSLMESGAHCLASSSASLEQLLHICWVFPSSSLVSASKENSLSTPALAMESTTLFPSHLMCVSRKASFPMRIYLRAFNFLSHLQFLETWVMRDPPRSLRAMLIMIWESPSTTSGSLPVCFVQIRPLISPSSSTMLFMFVPIKPQNSLRM